jgi:hypothetical protein
MFCSKEHLAADEREYQEPALAMMGWTEEMIEERRRVRDRSWDRDEP